MRSAIQDFRGALRTLARRRGTTILIAGLLALGIGLCTAVFSLFNAVFLRSLPVRRPGELVMLTQHIPKLGNRSELPFAYYQSLLRHARSLDAIGETEWPSEFALGQPAPAEEVTLRAVTGNYFQVLGVSALNGRALLPGDATPGTGSPPAVLSYDFWRRRFSGALRPVLGENILINKSYFAVVGVMPRGFNGLSADTSTEVWVPLDAFPAIAKMPLNRIDLELAGRLRPGFTIAGSQAECRTIFQAVMKDYYLNVAKVTPQEGQALLARKLALRPLARGTSVLRQNFGRELKLFIGLAGLLMIIVCSNVGGLLLAQIATRRHEFAVRLAVGATRARLIRQVLVEALILAALAATGGLLISLAAMPLIVRIIPPIRALDTTLVPLSIRLGFNARIFLFVLMVSSIALLVFCSGPVIALSRLRLDGLLRTVRASRGARERQALITLQITLCTFLLVLAALFIRTTRELNRVSSGMDVTHIEAFTGDLTAYKSRAALLETFMGRVRAMPGVVSCAIASIGVMRGHGTFASVGPAGQRMTQADFLDSAASGVSPRYFDTMGMHILEGRGFIESDIPKTEQKGPVATVVNETFAQRFFPHTDPVGKFFGVGTNGIARPQNKIIGVVSDAKDRSLREPIPPMFYGARAAFGEFVLYVRTRGRPDAIIEPVTRLWREMGPGAPFIEIDTLAQEARQTTANERLAAALASLFAALSALFAATGIYALLSYIVTQRRREIGIRMALGARPRHIAALIGVQTLVMTALGAAAGIACALAAGAGVRALLYGVTPADPKSLAAAILFVAFIAAIATLFPVLRAIRTQPAETLRQEN